MVSWFALIWLPHRMGTWDKSSTVIPKTEPTIDGLLPTGKPSSPRLQTTLRLGNTAMKRESSPGLETGGYISTMYSSLQSPLGSQTMIQERAFLFLANAVVESKG